MPIRKKSSRKDVETRESDGGAITGIGVRVGAFYGAGALNVAQALIKRRRNLTLSKMHPHNEKTILPRTVLLHTHSTIVGTLANHDLAGQSHMI